MYIGDLIDSLACDACQGSVVWRLSSLSTMVNVLSTLRVQDKVDTIKTTATSQELNYRDVFGSRATIQAIQLLNNKGHLSKIVSLIGPSAKEINLFRVANTSDELQQNESIFTTVISFCIQVAACVEGVESLFACDIISRILSLSYFLNPPPSVEEVTSFGTDALLAQKEAIKTLYGRLLPVLRLLRVAAITLSESKVIVAAIVDFFRRNHLIINEILLLKHFNSLEGMSVTEAVTGLLIFVLLIHESFLSDPALHRFLDTSMKNIGFLIKNLGIIKNYLFI